MTIPYLMNCEHSQDGWCLDCVAKLASKLQNKTIILPERQNSMQDSGIVDLGFVRGWNACLSSVKHLNNL